MSKKKKKKELKTLNPCLVKGRYGGKRGGAYQFRKANGQIYVPQGCGCNTPNFAETPGSKSGRELKRRHLYIDKKSFQIVPLPGNGSVGELLEVVPCKEAFLRPTSNGTKAWAEHPRKTEFRGCYDIEEDLLKEKLVRHEPYDNLTISSDQDQEDFSEDVSHQLGGLIASQSDAYAFNRQAYLNNLRREEGQWTQGRQSQNTPATPWDVAAHLANQKKNLEQLLYLLTSKQREAVRLIYLESDENPTNASAAKRLNISVDSLKDRLGVALKRIQKVDPLFKFPERRKSSGDAKIWESADSEFDGLYRKSNASPSEVRVLDPTSFEVKLSMAVEKFKAQKTKKGAKKKRKPSEKKVKEWAAKKTPTQKFS